MEAVHGVAPIDGRVNVLHLRDTSRICGPGKTIIETACAVDRRHYHTLVGVFSVIGRTNVYVEAVRARGIEVHALSARTGLDPRLLLQVSKLITERRVQIVHSHDYLSDIVARVVSSWLGVATMSTVHGWIENNARSRLYIKASQWALRGLDHVVAVSEETRNRVLKAGVSEGRLSVIHNAIVEANYRPANFEIGEFRRSAGIGPESVVVGNVGRLSPEKGQADFLRAAARLAAAEPKLRLVLAGDGPDEQALRGLADALGLKDRVVFTGHLTDVRPLYRDLDVLALTSYTEGFPNVLLEALCMGVPVLATDVGGVREIITDAETGVLVNAGSTAQIYEGLRRLVGDRPWATLLARRGKARVMEEFEFAARTPKEEAIYRRLLSQRHG
ncbi:glycosyltransferase [Luteitalea sp.]|uniref:glycosyltransferase n=1 Tax=Luteitalea sp. TaxID=2004800 RepID=UPI0025BEFA57|nr:glycosyltransferase [Luteitalea sp.]